MTNQTLAFLQNIDEDQNVIPIIESEDTSPIDMDFVKVFFADLDVNPIAAYTASVLSPDSDMAQVWFLLTQELNTGLNVIYTDKNVLSATEVQEWQSLMSLNRHNAPTIWVWNCANSDDTGAVVIDEHFTVQVIGPTSRADLVTQLQSRPRDSNELIADVAGTRTTSIVAGTGYSFELHLFSDDGEVGTIPLLFQWDGASDGSHLPCGSLVSKNSTIPQAISEPFIESLLTGYAENGITHGEFYLLNQDGICQWDLPSKEEQTHGLRVLTEFKYLLTCERIGIRDDHVERMLDRYPVPLKENHIDEIENPRSLKP